ncbi:MAG: 50S ribosomal protein L3 [Candidatus Woesearchaeota archaeon]
MPNVKRPRHGSMQYWPRKRAKREYPKVRHYATVDKAIPLGFAGYKVGMTHVMCIDNRKFSKTKGEEISIPVTIIECPPLKIFSIRFYKKTADGFKLLKEVVAKPDKELSRKVVLPKKQHDVKFVPEDYDDIRINVYTQPRLTGVGKKKPDMFELQIGGKLDTKLKYAQENLGKEIHVKDIFKEGMLVDVHAVTKGKGFQGPVKRFGVQIRSHKAEKTKRGPGSLGAWNAQGHIMYRVAHAGQMGYHTRTEYNKQLLKIGDKPDEINREGGFLHYGKIRNPYLFVKGSVQGPAKRLVRLCYSIRPQKAAGTDVSPTIEYVYNIKK